MIQELTVVSINKVLTTDGEEILVTTFSDGSELEESLRDTSELLRELTRLTQDLF